MSLAATRGPAVAGGHVTFALADADRRFRSVRLIQEVADPRPGPYLRRVRGTRTWVVRFRRPPVDRMEYLFEVAYVDGRTERIRDPENPLRTPGAFGDKSVVEFPGYRPPEWLAGVGGLAGTRRSLAIQSGLLPGRLSAIVWSSARAGRTRPLPLLVVHDGRDYARYAALLRLLDWMTAAGRLPRSAPRCCSRPVPPPGRERDAWVDATRRRLDQVREILVALRRQASVGGRTQH